MPRTMQQRLPDVEEKTPLRADKRTEESSAPSLDVPFRMAKTRAGAAIAEAIGEHPLKEFGHEGFVSAVCSGDKVPEYLARIVQDDETRRRFARALLRGAKRVKVREIFEFED